MTNSLHLTEQHILEYESRLKHIDELLERAHEGAGKAREHVGVKGELVELQRERDKLASLYDRLRLKKPEDWQEEEIEKSGPMGVWDAVAQQLEKLVERIER